MSRTCLVCAPPPFATTSRSGFSRGQCARMANAAMTTVHFFVSLWCIAPERRGFTLEEIRQLFFGFPPGTPPPKRWHQLSQRKIAELRNGMKRLKLMETLLKRVESCRCDALDECGEKILRQGRV